MELTFYGASGGLARGTIVSEDCPEAIRWQGKLYKKLRSPYGGPYVTNEGRHIYCEEADYFDIPVSIWQRLRSFFKRLA